MKEMRWEADRWRRRGRVKGGRASKGPGDIYRSRTLQQTPTWTKNTQRGWLCMTMKYGHRAGVQSRRRQVPFLLPKPLGIPSASHHISFPSQPLRGAPELPSHEQHRLRPSRVQWTALSSAKGTKDFLSRVQSLSVWRRLFLYLVKYFVMKNSPLKTRASAFNTFK